MEPTTAFTVKLRGAPFNVKEVSAVKTSTLVSKGANGPWHSEVCLKFKFIVFATATNSRVHDPTEACSNQDREERKREPNRLVGG